MDLPSRVDFRFARLEKVELQSNEDGGKGIMVVSVPLTPALAEVFQRKEMLYHDNGVAYEFTGNIGVPLTVTDVQFALKFAASEGDAVDLSLSPEKIRCFTVTHSDDKKETGDAQLRLNFRVHLSIPSDVDAAYEAWKTINNKTFECRLLARQQELFGQTADQQADPFEAATQ